MGWVIKTIAFLVAIMLFGVGAWPLSLLILGVLLLPTVVRGRRRNGASGEASQKRRIPVRYLAGGLLFILALLGFAAHGTYSPIVFASLGLLVLSWGRVNVPGVALGLEPVDETILLKNRFLPITWAAVAEVKPLARDLGRALAGLDGTVLVVGPAAKVYVVIRKFALGERAAQEAILGTLKEMSSSITPSGAYLLPLDAGSAFGLLEPSVEAVKFEERLWSNALTTSTFDTVVIEQEGGFAKRLGLLRKVGAKSQTARAAFGGKALARPPFLMEVYKDLGSKMTWPQPDQTTAFLSSLSATRSEPLGTRFLEVNDVSTTLVSVRSAGGPAVELSRAQLRAVAAILGRD